MTNTANMSDVFMWLLTKELLSKQSFSDLFFKLFKPKNIDFIVQ